MSRAYAHTELRRFPPIVDSSLAEPKSLSELRTVLRNRARRENGHDGRSELRTATILEALAALNRGVPAAKAVGFCENFLGGTGLVKISGLRIELTAAGHSLLADAERHGMRP